MSSALARFLTVRFNLCHNRIKMFEGWPVTLGLAALLALTGVARWKLGFGQQPPRVAAPAPPSEALELPVRVAVSSDGSITVASEGKTVSLEDVAREIRASGAKRRVELSVDPNARGAIVDALLNGLREVGASQCTLLVDLAAARANSPESSREPAR
jgi:hypothetical protein